MTLPSAFVTSETYLQDCVTFLRTYQHLYNFRNTDVLINNVLDNINSQDLESVDVFAEDFNITNANNFLEDFFLNLERFKVFYDDVTEHLETKVDGLSPKKRHEIVCLAKEIAVMCEETECDTVVDFGSGLGYLDQFLFETTNLKVLGLECNESHYVGAKTRQRKYHVNSVANVKYIKHFISENSHTNIQDYLKDKFGNHTGFCITGLHACADLTVDAINLFLKMADAKSMVIMPCCYHKMKRCDERFVNFPLSSCLKEIFEEDKAFEYMRVPLLRLAAQPPCRTEDNLEDSVFNLLARAVLQLYAHRHNCKLKRNKRKAVKMKTVNNDFSNYIQEASNGFKLIHQTELNDENKIINFNSEELLAIWQSISQSYFKKAAIFILLQNNLQPVIENFILYDRLMFIQQNGVECRFKRIVNERISPRCLALLAKK